MKNAKLDVVKFDSNDVIATSAMQVTLSNIRNGISGDMSVTGAISLIGSDTKFVLDPYIRGQSNFVSGADDAWLSGNTLSAIENAEEANNDKMKWYNGTYTWDGTNFIHQ